MSKKTSIILIVSIIIICVSLAISIYIPNKEKLDDEIEDKSIVYTVIEENGKYGVINQNNEEVIDAQYDKIIIPNEHRAVFICQNGEESKVLNNQNQEIFKNYDSIEPIQLYNLIDETYDKNALICQKNGRYGLLAITGKVILDAEYDDIYSLGYKENEVIVKDNNKFKIYDVKGNALIKDEFDSIESDKYYDENDGYKKSGYIVCKITSDGYQYGYYDYEYSKVLDLEYDQISRIVEVQNKDNIYLLAAKNGQYGVFINNSKIIDTQYQSISYDSDLRLFIVERTGQFGAINENGVEILTPEYTSLQINGIYLYAQNQDIQKVFDKDGKEVNIPFTTVIEKTTNPDYFIERENDKYGIIDSKNNVIIEVKYDLIQEIKDTNIFQAVDFETNTTFIYNNELQLTVEMTNASIETADNSIRIYNETEQYYLDNNGNIIENNDTP